MVRAAVAAVAGMTCLFALTLGAARAWEINFEGLPDHGAGIGLVIDDEYATPGTITDDPSLTATIAGFRGTGPARQPAVLFDTGAGQSGRGNPFANSGLAAPFSNGEGSLHPGHVLILHEVGTHRPGRIEIDFGTDVVSLDSIDFFDIEDDDGDPNRADEANEVQLFGVNGNQIMDDAFYVPATGGDNRWAVLNFGGISGVSRIVVNLSGRGAIDNIRGGPPSQTASLDTTEPDPQNSAEIGIPEPASAPLMVLGLGALVWLRRRYRRG